eukprot:CCRYP_004402-RB/>CCRYP_004402-RB protein AED:0.41 eAED:0.79 QI:0/0/0/1/0/0/2/0/127
MMGGTLLELRITPCCEDKADCSSRKFRYLVTVDVINDDTRRIREYPGCGEIWWNVNTVMCFSPKVSILLQTLHMNQIEHVVPAFKSSPGMGLRQPPEKQLFNMCLSSPRCRAHYGIVERKVWMVGEN